MRDILTASLIAMDGAWRNKTGLQAYVSPINPGRWVIFKKCTSQLTANVNRKRINMTEQRIYFETNSIPSFIYEWSGARCWMRPIHLSRTPTLFSMPISLTTNLGTRPSPGLSASEREEGDGPLGVLLVGKVAQETLGYSARLFCSSLLLHLGAPLFFLQERKVRTG